MPHIVLFLFRLPYIYRNGFELSACLTSMSSLKWDMSQPSKLFIARETMHKSRQYQISIHQNFQYSNTLKSDTPFQFNYISASKYCTEKFLYSRKSYGSHLSNELCPSLLACLQPEKLSKNCCAFFSGHPVSILTLKFLWSPMCKLWYDIEYLKRKEELLCKESIKID